MFRDLTCNQFSLKEMDYDKDLLQELVDSHKNLCETKELLRSHVNEEAENPIEDPLKKEVKLEEREYNLRDMKTELKNYSVEMKEERIGEINEEYDVKMEHEDRIKIHQCEFCELTSESLYSLKRHMKRKHCSDKRYKCSFCTYSAIYGRDLEIHIAARHSATKTEFRCQTCEFSTFHSIYLKKHIRRNHIRKKNFKCDFCNYSAFEAKFLKLHIAAHHGDTETKNFKCEKCEFSTVHSEYLVKHFRRVHLEEKKFKCEFCDYASFQRRGLQFHMDSHHKNSETDTKACKCEHCEFSSAHPASLVKHVRRYHSKDKKNVCYVCNYTAMDDDALKFHLKSRHRISGEESGKFKCEECDLSTNYRSSLKRHIKVVHLKMKKEK